MDDFSDILNFEHNENRPILDNHKVNDNEILNVSSENKLTAAGSVAFFQNTSPLNEKQVLTNVNNNFQNEKPTVSYTVSEGSTGVKINNSGENISLLSPEAGTTKAENVNSSSLANETKASIETANIASCKSLQDNSGYDAKFDNDSDIKSAILDSNEVPVGNVNFLSETLSDEVFSDSRKNLCIDTASSNEMSMTKMENIDSSSTSTEEKNNSYVVVPDLVDFSFREQENITGNLLENLSGIDSLSKKQTNKSLEETSSNNPGVNVQENKSANLSTVLLGADFASEVSKSPTNILEECGVTENCNILGDSLCTLSPPRISENPVKEDVIKSGNVSMELVKPSINAEVISTVDSDSTNNEYQDVNRDETVLQVAEDTSVNEPEVSPLKVEKVSLGMSDKSLEEFTESMVPEVSVNDPLEQFSGPDFGFKVPEVPSSNPVEKFSDSDSGFKVPDIPSSNPLEEFSDSDFGFKVPEVPSNNPLGEFSDPDFSFKMPEVPFNNPLEQISGPDFINKMPENPLTKEGDEQFVDAVQFFKDPNSFQFLENIRTSTVQPSSSVPRSSLYVNFDPLHSKFQTPVPRQDNCALITAAVQENNASVENSEKCSPGVVNKHLVDVASRESLGNILISFDSPKSSSNVDSKIPVHTPTPVKMFTEEEVQQKLKIHELETQEAYLKKQREMEMEIAKRDDLLKCQQIVMEEFCGISLRFSDDIRKDQEKITSLEAENEKLKEDLKTSAEDLQSVENTFTDFYKRYEQCKGMLKTYKDNEEHLKQTISDLQTKAKEQEQMYHMLQERTEEMLEKANVEVDNVKRSGEAQVTVLKAQLKKAEMKISSLESDIKQIKIENSELGGICDDLMAKVSRS